MNYAGYVVAAYGIFAAVLLWDFIAPRVRIAQVMRTVRLLAARRRAAAEAPLRGELKR